MQGENEKIRRNLQQLARTCQWLVLWLDCDREGENIAFEVIQVGAGALRSLGMCASRRKRRGGALLTVQDDVCPACPQVCTEVNPRLTIRRARFSGACSVSVAVGSTCCAVREGAVASKMRPFTPATCPPVRAALIYADVARAINNLALPNEHEAKAVDARQVGVLLLHVGLLVAPPVAMCMERCQVVAALAGNSGRYLAAQVSALPGSHMLQEIDLRIGASFTRLQVGAGWLCGSLPNAMQVAAAPQPQRCGHAPALASPCEECQLLPQPCLPASLPPARRRCCCRTSLTGASTRRMGASCSGGWQVLEAFVIKRLMLRWWQVLQACVPGHPARIRRGCTAPRPGPWASLPSLHQPLPPAPLPLPLPQLRPLPVPHAGADRAARLGDPGSHHRELLVHPGERVGGGAHGSEAVSHAAFACAWTVGVHVPGTDV